MEIALPQFISGYLLPIIRRSLASAYIMQTIWSLLLLLGVVSGKQSLTITSSYSISLAQKCYFANSVCVYSQIQNASTIVLTVHSKAKGWTGFGFGGNGMGGADMYIGWKGSQGPIVSYRVGTPTSDPTLSQASNGFKQIPLAIKTTSADYVTAFSFSRPLKPTTGKAFPSGVSDYLLAYTDAPPSQVDSVNSPISRHTVARVISEDFLALAQSSNKTGGPTAGTFKDDATLSDLDRDTVILIHGICMFIAWGVSPFIG